MTCQPQHSVLHVHPPSPFLSSCTMDRGEHMLTMMQDLPQADRARLLTQLAAKVFSHTVGV
jgi:hypothetical protein